MNIDECPEPSCIAGTLIGGGDCTLCGGTGLASVAIRNAALAAKTSGVPYGPPSAGTPDSSPAGVTVTGSAVTPAGHQTESLVDLSIAGVLIGLASFLFPKWADKRATKRREERQFATWPAALRGDQGHEHQERR